VSSDFNSCSLSSIIDAKAGLALTPNFVKVKRGSNEKKPLRLACLLVTDAIRQFQLALL
jgi:hypothetical protein